MGSKMKQKSKYQKKCRLKSGDEVIVTTGKCKGETGKIDRIDFDRDRVYVGGVNISKKHAKPSGNQEGGIIDKVMPLHVSNVALLDSKTKKPTKIGYRLENNKKVRFAKASGNILD